MQVTDAADETQARVQRSLELQLAAANACVTRIAGHWRKRERFDNADVQIAIVTREGRPAETQPSVQHGRLGADLDDFNRLRAERRKTLARRLVPLYEAAALETRGP